MCYIICITFLVTNEINYSSWLLKPLQINIYKYFQFEVFLEEDVEGAAQSTVRHLLLRGIRFGLGCWWFSDSQTTSDSHITSHSLLPNLVCSLAAAILFISSASLKLGQVSHILPLTTHHTIVHCALDLHQSVNRVSSNWAFGRPNQEQLCIFWRTSWSHLVNEILRWNWR